MAPRPNLPLVSAQLEVKKDFYTFEKVGKTQRRLICRITLKLFKIQIWVAISEVLLEHNQRYSLPSSLFSCFHLTSAELSSLNGERVAHKAKNIYYLALRRSLLTPDIGPGSEQSLCSHSVRGGTRIQTPKTYRHCHTLLLVSIT